MACNMPILFLFSTSAFFLLAHLVSPLSDACSSSSCGHGQLEIKFPFRLKQFQPDERCVYPGFDLLCDARNLPTLYLPTSGEFIVDSIDYDDQVVWLKDPDDCLPKRLQNFTTSGSNWTVQHYTSFTLFKCLYERWDSPTLARVACLDGLEYYVVAVATDELSQDMDTLLELRCGDSWTVQIPTVDDMYPSPYNTIDYTKRFGLTWAEPSCKSCEAHGGTCWFKGKNGLETECTFPNNDASQKGKNDSLWIFMGITIGITIGIPGIIFITRLLRYIICEYCIGRQVQQDQTDPSSLTGRAQTLEAVSGMDTPAIELYPMTQIGDGGASMPRDNTCSICLSEYRLKEMVRTIPECKHSFHAHCIDPWLRRNGSCPLCRNYPRYVTVYSPYDCIVTNSISSCER